MGIYTLQVSAVPHKKEDFGLVDGSNRPVLTMYGFFRSHGVAYVDGKTHLSLSFDTDPIPESEKDQLPSKETFYGRDCDYQMRFIASYKDEPISLSKMKIAFATFREIKHGVDKEHLTQNGKRIANLQMESIYTQNFSNGWEDRKAVVEKLEIPCESEEIVVLMQGWFQAPPQWFWKSPEVVIGDFYKRYAN